MCDKSKECDDFIALISPSIKKLVQIEVRKRMEECKRYIAKHIKDEVYNQVAILDLFIKADIDD